MIVYAVRKGIVGEGELINHDYHPLLAQDECSSGVTANYIAIAIRLHNQCHIR